MTKESKFKAGVVQFDVKSGQIEANLYTDLGHRVKDARTSIPCMEDRRDNIYG